MRPTASRRPTSTRCSTTISLRRRDTLKGGISVALALSLSDSDWKPLILTATFIVVVFSITVPGLTIAPLARMVQGKLAPHESMLLKSGNRL